MDDRKMNIYFTLFFNVEHQTFCVVLTTREPLNTRSPIKILLKSLVTQADVMKRKSFVKSRSDFHNFSIVIIVVIIIFCFTFFAFLNSN